MEVHFSLVQRKVLAPNETDDLELPKQRLLDFQGYYEMAARPFTWEFTRADLHHVLARLQQRGCFPAAHPE